MLYDPRWPWHAAAKLGAHVAAPHAVLALAAARVQGPVRERRVRRALRRHSLKLNPLGRTGLFVSELCLGTMTFGGGEGMWKQIGQLAAGRRRALVGARSTPASTSSTPPTSIPTAARKRSPARRCKNLERAARERRRRDQGVRRDRAGRQHARRVAQPHHRRVEGEPEAPAARSRRPLPDPRLRSGDADRGDGARARHAGRARPCPLRRRLELGRVADHEGARHLRAARPRALRERCRPTTRSPGATSSASSCRCCRAKASG